MNKETIITFEGKNPGPVTTIMVGIHGNEKAGILALNKLLQNNFSIDAGIVYFIYANIAAMQADVRYLERNMNRCFSENISGITCEEQRTQELIPYLKQSDYLLDVHNTTNKYNSVPMLICEYSDLGKYFDVKYVVSGFDALHPGGSDGYMNQIGKIGLCIECGSIYDNTGPELAKKSILNFLRYTGNLSGTVILYSEQLFVKFSTIYKNKTNNFRFEKKFSDMEKVAVGQLIARDGDEEIRAENDYYLLFAAKPKNIGDECFVLGK